ncbi:hypothetical protein [Nostoc sp.]
MSDCFETFPFLKNWETNPTLETLGKTYYEYYSLSLSSSVKL